MNNDNVQYPTGHTITRYNEELATLCNLVIDMGETVVRQIKDAGICIKTGDVEIAKNILQTELHIDKMDVSIEEKIIQVLALRQPVAKDLRVILSVNKIISFLERIGDQARVIAELSLKLYDNEHVSPDEKLIGGIPRMTRFVYTMVHLAIQSFKNQDIELAIEVIEMDAELEEQFDSAIRSISTYVMQDPRKIGNAVDVLMGLRSLDRIGGHAKSISRQLIFMVKGINIRHESFEDTISAVRS